MSSSAALFRTRLDSPLSRRGTIRFCISGYFNVTRKVKKDNTFSFRNRRYETPVNLPDKEIQLRYDRRRIDESNSVVVIYFKGQRMGSPRLLDAVANGLLRRKEQ